MAASQDCKATTRSPSVSVCAWRTRTRQADRVSCHCGAILEHQLLPGQRTCQAGATAGVGSRCVHRCAAGLLPRQRLHDRRGLPGLCCQRVGVCGRAAPADVRGTALPAPRLHNRHQSPAADRCDRAAPWTRRRATTARGDARSMGMPPRVVGVTRPNSRFDSSPAPRTPGVLETAHAIAAHGAVARNRNAFACQAWVLPLTMAMRVAWPQKLGSQWFAKLLKSKSDTWIC